MASEKGATHLDKLCHKFYDYPKGYGEKTDYVCRLCGGPLETRYCEERLYLVRCADCGTFALVKAANPKAAARVTLATPALTPPNEWVSVENALPPNMDDVLVVVQNNGECWTVTGYYSNTSNVWYAMLNGQDTKMDVLWWMPFPAPPDRRPPEEEEDT